MHKYLKAHGWTDWTSAVGFRADEPRRVAKLSSNEHGDYEVRVAPLAREGISAREVGQFWLSQPFDLRLPNAKGKSTHGNCDLCFLKGADQTMSLIREEPERAIWWIQMEKKPLLSAPEGGWFRKDRPSYAEMHRMATNHGELFPFEDESIECGVCID